MSIAKVHLSEKQLRWVDEYLVDLNATAAAKRALYSVRCARSIGAENLSKPAIQAALRERQATLARDLQITQQGVIRGLLDGIEIAREQRNPGAMISALGVIAKMFGYVSAQAVQVKANANELAMLERLDRMSDEDLGRVIAAGGRTQRQGRPVSPSSPTTFSS